MAATSWDSLDSWFDILTLVGTSLQIRRDHVVSHDLPLLIHRQYHTLRLVCKAFRDLYRKHPSLSDCVLVREGLPGSRVPQLLNALHRKQASTHPDLVRPSSGSRGCTGCFALSDACTAEADSELGK